MPAVSPLKPVSVVADSEEDSRLGTDGNQPGLERREGAADDAALLMPKNGFTSVNPFGQRPKTLAAQADGVVAGPRSFGRSPRPKACKDSASFSCPRTNSRA
jgi:hypothetical protein